MAVYTHISEEELTQFLSRFNIGRLVSYAGIVEGIDNSNYRLTTTAGDFILTLFEKRIRREDLPFYIGFMEYLHAKTVPCPDVVRDKSGTEISSLQGKPAAVTTFLQGSWPRQIENFHAAAVGKTLAQMHLAGKNFPQQRDNALSLPAWKNLISQCPEADPDLLRFLQQEVAYLEENWLKNLPAGAIHADLFPDNVFFTGRKLTGIIDFYFACTDTFVYDLMLTVNAWCFDPAGELNSQKSTALLDAYQNERPLTAAEHDSLAFFGRAAALRIISTRLYDMLHPAAGAVIKLKDPLEYVNILKFYQTKKFSV